MVDLLTADLLLPSILTLVLLRLASTDLRLMNLLSMDLLRMGPTILEMTEVDLPEDVTELTLQGSESENVVETETIEIGEDLQVLTMIVLLLGEFCFPCLSPLPVSCD